MLHTLGVKFPLKLILAGISLSGIMKFVESFTNKYIFTDWQFLIWLFILIFLDTFTGAWSAIVKKEFGNEGWFKVVKKIILYGICLIVTHDLTSFTVAGKSMLVFSWLDDAIYSTLIIREAISIFEHIAIIAPGIFPAWILERLKKIEFKQIPKRSGNKTVKRKTS